MNKIYLATGNLEKVKEAQAILGIPVEIANIELDEIQSMNLREVAKRKAEEAYRIVKKPVFVEDVSIKIEALNGFPGPLVKFFLQTLGNEKVLELLKGEKNRKVKVESATGYHDGEKTHVFIGSFEGTISSKLRGDDGWGFDFFVIPEGYTQTFAEMGFEKKNKISHRRKSLEMLKKFLGSKTEKINI